MACSVNDRTNITQQLLASFHKYAV